MTVCVPQFDLGGGRRGAILSSHCTRCKGSLLKSPKLCGFRLMQGKYACRAASVKISRLCSGTGLVSYCSTIV